MSETSANLAEPTPSWRGPLVGFVGAVLLALVSVLASPLVFGPLDRATDPLLRAGLATIGIAGSAALIFGWLDLRHSPPVKLWRSFALWSLPLLLVPPLFSKDGYAYLEQGWIVASGFDPYTTPLGSIGGPFGHYVDSYWLGTTTVYPPLALLIQALAVLIGGGSVWATIIILRLISIACVAVIGLSVDSIARSLGRRSSRALWWTIVNPLVVAHLIGGIHNDGWAIALATAGIALSFRKGWGWLVGCALTGLAFATKQPLGLAVIACALTPIAMPDTTTKESWARSGWQAVGRVIVGLIIALGAFGIVTALTGWGLGWATADGMPYATGSQSLAHQISGLLHFLTPLSMAEAKQIVAVVFTIIWALWMAWLGIKIGLRRPVAYTAWGLIGYALSYASLQPWYPMWGGVLLGSIALSHRVKRVLVASIVYFMGTSIFLELGQNQIGTAIALSAVVAVGFWAWDRRSTMSPTTDE